MNLKHMNLKLIPAGGYLYPRLVGFCGRAGSGKDTAASYLTTLFNYRKVAFADALRRATAAITGWHVDVLNSPTFKNTLDARFGCTPRQFMQRLGTEVGRNMDPDLWLKAWAATVHDTPEERGIVVTDVRFHNEAQAIRDAGGLLIRIKRPVADAAPVEHESEAHVDDLGAPLTVNNTGSHEDLWAKLESLLIGGGSQ